MQKTNIKTFFFLILFLLGTGLKDVSAAPPFKLRDVWNGATNFVSQTYDMLTQGATGGQAFWNSLNTFGNLIGNNCGTWSYQTQVYANGISGQITVCPGVVTLSVAGDVQINSLNSALSDQFMWYKTDGTYVGSGRTLSINVTRPTTFYAMGKKYSVLGSHSCSYVRINSQVTVNVVTPNGSSSSAINYSMVSGATYTSYFGISGSTYSWTASYNAGTIRGASPGSGSVFSQTLTNNTGQIQYVTYSVIPYTSGCAGTPFTVTVLVYPVPKIPNFSITICSGQTVTLTPVNGTFPAGAIVPNPTYYYWNAPVVTGGMSGGTPSSGYFGFSPNIVQALTNPLNTIQTATYTITPVYYYGAIPVNAGQTVFGNSFVITVYVKPAAPSMAVNSATICKGDAAVLTATGTSISYLWSTNAVTSSITVSPTATTSYTVSGFKPNSCTAMAVATVSVLSINAGPDKTICQGNQVMLSATGANNYIWTPAADLNNAFVSNPLASPAATTTYTVMTMCASGRTLSDNAIVTVNPNPPLTLASSLYMICSGQSVVLNASGQGAFSWSPAQGLNNTNIAAPTASPSVSRGYHVTLTNTTTGCSSSGDVNVIVNSVSITPDITNVTIERGERVQLHVTTSSGVGGAGIVSTPGIPGTPVFVSWLPAAGLNTLTGNTVWASPDVTTTYTVYAQVANCVAQATVVVTVIEKPNAAFVFSYCTQVTGPNTGYFFTNNRGTFNYAWNFGDGSTSTAIAPQHHYASPGLYNVCLQVSNQLSTDKFCEQIKIPSAQ